jgi:hypothetical protein
LGTETKTGFARVDTELATRTTGMKSDLAKITSELNTSFSEGKGEMKSVKSDITLMRWQFGAMSVGLVGFFSVNSQWIPILGYLLKGMIVDKALETNAAKMFLNTYLRPGKIDPGYPIYTYDITEILGAANYLAYW